MQKSGFLTTGLNYCSDLGSSHLYNIPKMVVFLRKIFQTYKLSRVIELNYNMIALRLCYHFKNICSTCKASTERRENTCLQGFRPGPTQTGLYGHRKWLVRDLKFRVYEEEGLYYLCSENKGADQLRR